MFQQYTGIYKNKNKNDIHTCISVCFQCDKGFDRQTFEKQMSVMRGQVRTCIIN